MQQLLLAALLVDAGRPVSVDRLTEAMWAERDGPTDRASQVYVHVGRLRRALGDDSSLVRSGEGYVLRAESDIARFEELVRQGREAEDPEATAAALTEALELWRGQPYAGADECLWLRSEVIRLQSLRLDALEARIGAELQLGRHTAVAAELGALTREHPAREGFWELLLLALYRAGRQAEALEAYQELYRKLDDELGIQPGHAIRELHRRILSDDPTLEFTPSTEPRVVPRQLPADVPDFTGREKYLALLDEPQAILITGMGGVGKTALAVRWATLHADDYPDGQLYVDLRGYGPGEQVTTAAALETLCRSLGADEIPTSMEERASFYRSLLARKHILVLLDNARSVEQIRPLLPGPMGGKVLITSRNDLPGLVAREGVARVMLGALVESEAMDLLARLVGMGRVETEPSACRALIGHCAGLPLALRIAAERLLHRQSESIADLTAELTDRSARLDLLESPDDPTSAVRAVFSWSYDALPPSTAKVFRLLGVHPGPNFDEHASANLTDLSLTEARSELDRLTRAHLVEVDGGRFRMHDLLRVYAGELSDDDGTALARLCDYYLHAASAAADTHQFERWDRATQVGTPAVSAPEFPDSTSAMAWLATENDNLVALTHRAAEAGLHGHSWRICDALGLFYYSTDRRDDWLATHHAALTSAIAAGDRPAEAHLTMRLGTAYGVRHQYEESVDHALRAIALFEELGDRHRTAVALRGLGWVYQWFAQFHSAVETAKSAASIYRELGDVAGEAIALTNLVIAASDAGVTAEILELGERALESHLRSGQEFAAGSALVNLGDIYCNLGRFADSLDSLQQAISLFEPIGADRALAWCYEIMAEVHLREGRAAAALEACETGLRHCGPRNPALRGALTGLQAVAYAELGRSDLARRCLQEAEGSIAAQRSAAIRAYVHLSCGQAHHRLGRDDQATKNYHAAAELLAPIHAPYRKGRVHRGLAEVAHAQGDHHQVELHLEIAVEHMTAYGAISEADAIRSQLRSMRH